MLQLTLGRDDYLMIGDNIRLQYKRDTGDGRFSIAIAAPRDVKILRKNLYENTVEKMAAQGNPTAQILADVLQEETPERLKEAEQRRVKQQQAIKR